LGSKSGKPSEKTFTYMSRNGNARARGITVFSVSLYFASTLASCGAVASKLQHDEVPDVEEPSEAGSVLRRITSQVSTLQKIVTDAQKDNELELSSRKKEYESKLDFGRKANEELASTNAALNLDIEKLRASNEELRKQAQELEKANGAMTAKLEAQMSNITVAKDFVATSLKNGKQKGLQELSILEELKAQDAERWAHKAKDEWVGNLGLSLLQVQESPADDSVIGSLQTALSSVSAEYNRSKKLLHEAFLAEQVSIQDGHEALLAEQQGLNATKAGLIDRGSRLEAAVKFLQERQRRLHDRLVSLQLFNRRLSTLIGP